MSTATPIRQLQDWRGNATLYRLSEPLEGNEYVVVSGISNEWGREAYIFAADADGEVLEWGELPGSYRGDISHVEALRGAGYEVAA